LLILAGAVLQILGFGFALRRIFITRRRELPDDMSTRHRLLCGARSRLDLSGHGSIDGWVVHP
jgi:hypothetical protein